MSVRPAVRRAASVVAGATIALSAGPLAGVAFAANPVLAANGLSPASGAVTATAPATVSACFTETLLATSTITLAKGASSVPADPTAATLASCDGGTSNKLVFTPDDPLTHGVYTATATANNFGVPDGPGQTVVAWSFTIDTQAPTAPHTLAMTDPVNAATAAAAVVTGKTDPNTAVSVSVAKVGVPAVTATGNDTSDANGDFSIEGVDLTGLADGQLVATVKATDVAGNFATGTVNAVKETSLPTRVSTTPAHGATSKTRNTVVVTFSEPLNTAASSLVVRNGFGNRVAEAATGSPAFSNGDTTVTFTSASPMTAAGGVFTVTAQVQDLAGNPASATPTTFTIDDTPPAAPTVTLTNPLNIANSDEAVVSGVAEPGSSVTVSVDDETVGSPVTGGPVPAHATTGAYTVPVDLTALADGAVVAKAVATDPAGNPSAPGASAASQKDTVAPAAPVISTMTDPVTQASQTTVTITGTAINGGGVAVSVDDADNATAAVTKSTTAHATTGAWSVTVDVTPLTDGPITARVVATDAAGNPSDEATRTVQMDTGLPATPSLEVPVVNNANKTAVPATGVAEPGSSVTVTLADGTHPVLTQVTTANNEGAYATAFNAIGLDDGTLTAKAVATDAAGNPSPAKTIQVTKDTLLPGMPAVTLPAYVNAATDQAVEASGTAEPGSTVRITVADGDNGTGDVTQSVVAAPNGTWTKTLDLTSLADGTVTATVVAEDAAGNTSAPASDTAEKDVVAPAAPAVSLTNPITPANVATATVSGAVANAATVAIAVDDADAATGVVPATGPVAGGTFAVSVDLTTLSDGPVTATATATDAAGNVSEPGASAASAKDTITLARLSTVPAGGATAQPPATVSATYNEPLNTSTSSISVADTSSSALAGATSFTNGGRTIVFTPADTLSDAGSPYTVTVVAKDLDGSDTAPEGTFSFSVDSVKPAKPSVSIPEVVNAANVASVPVSGTAEPGSTVAVSVDDTTAAAPVTGSVVAHATTGAYTLSLDLGSLGDTALVASATATDAAGNKSDAQTDTATKDAAVPAAPSVNLPAYVNAASKAAVPVSGVAEPGSSVTVSVDDATAGAPVAATVPAHATTGAWSTTLDLTSLADGTVTALATAQDAAGNTSTAGTDTAVKDTAVPAAPTVELSDPVNNASQTTATVSGVAEPGSSVAVSVDDTTPGTAPVGKTVAADGTTGAYSATVDLTTLADETLTASAVASDAAGNASPSASDTATKDAAVPAKPTVNLPAFVTAANTSAVPVTGTAEPGSTVTVSVDDTTDAAPVVGEATAHATTGAYSIGMNLSSLADGALAASAVAADAAGNTSAAGTDTATKDTGVPAAPTVDLPAFVNAASKAAVSVSGVAEPGSSVAVSVDDATAGSPVASAVPAHATTGAWSATLDLTSLADGALTATAVATDAAGNPSPAGSDTGAKDVITPAAPAVDLPAFVTAATKSAVPVTGTAEPGTSVTVTVDDATDAGAVVQSATADGTGAYSLAMDLSSLGDGALSGSATARDAAGNTSTAGTDSAAKDTVPPAAPTVTLADVTLANVTAVPASGAADPGTSVLVSVDDATPGSPVTKTVTADGTTGAWSTTLDLTSLADGALTASAVSSDAAGNPSAAGTDTAAKDATAPGTPTVELSDPVNAANKTTATVSGTAEPGSAVAISLDDATAGDALTAARTADAQTGAYSATFDVTALADGLLTATVTATDAVGNVSPAGADSAPKDSSVPDVAVLNPVAEVTHATFTAAPFSGTAEPGSTVTVVVDDADATTLPVTGTATAAAGEGAWSKMLDLSSLKDGALTVTVTATDAVGNVSGTTNGSTTKNVTRAFTIGVSATPVSGAAQSFSVTARSTYALDSAVDTTYTGTPVLTSADGHFTAGTCAAAVAGVASCTGTVFGDLGSQTLTATGGTAAEPVSGAKPVVVQPTGLVFSVAPATKASPGQAITFKTVPTAGVPGASLAGYSGIRKLVTTGGSTPQTGSVLGCAAAECTTTVSFATRGPKTVKVVDDGTPALSTPTASVTVPYGTVLSLFRSKAQVNAGQTVVLSGQLLNSTTLDGVGTRTVKLYRKTAPATTYSYFGSATTRADGTWSKTVSLTRNTAYQARFAGDATHLASNSTARVVKAAYVVSATWSSSGRTVKATGHVSPGAAGRTVHLQYRKADGTWGYAGVQTTASSTGGYTLSKAFAPGSYVFRVAISATSLNAAGYSSTLSIRLV